MCFLKHAAEELGTPGGDPVLTAGAQRRGPACSNTAKNSQALVRMVCCTVSSQRPSAANSVMISSNAHSVKALACMSRYVPGDTLRYALNCCIDDAQS